MKSNVKRNAFFTIVGFTLLIWAMMLLYVIGSNNFKLDVMYVITHVLILVFMLFINYQAFRMWQYKETLPEPKKQEEPEVELEIKEPAKD